MALEVLDITSACRLCLSVDPGSLLIFPEQPQSNALSLPKLISECVGFEIIQKKGLPSKICYMCHKEVSQWTAFRAKCQSTNDMLTKVMSQKFTVISLDSNLKAVENPPSGEMVLTNKTEENAKEKEVLSDKADTHTDVDHMTCEQRNDDDKEDSDVGENGNNMDNVDNDDQSSISDVWSRDEDDSSGASSSEDDVGAPPTTEDDDSKSWRNRMVKCPKCPKIFPKHYNLKCHLKNIHSLFKCYPCAVCGHTSVSSIKREKHVVESHQELLTNNPKRMCKICGVITQTKPSFYRHMKRHRQERHCKVCDKMLKSPEELETHSKTEHESQATVNLPPADSDPKFKCHHCKDVVFGNEKDWKEHYLLIHFTRAVYVCDLCEKTYRTKEHLEMHKHTHTGEKPYMCEICAVRFTGKSSLRSHMKTHLNRKFECKICQKEYTSYTGLYSHNRATHSGVDPYVCHECGKKFKSANGVIFHMRTHTGEKPYSCEQCNFTSHTFSGLYAHRVIHSDEKPFKCDECDKSFKLKGWLKVHKKTHGGVKNFVCEICNHSFIANYQLKSHMKVHSGERPHVCDICSKSFARKDTLTEHMRVHTKETKYTCKDCNLQFTFLKPFKRHKCAFRSSDANSKPQRENSLSENLEEERS